MVSRLARIKLIEAHLGLFSNGQVPAGAFRPRDKDEMINSRGASAQADEGNQDINWIQSFSRRQSRSSSSEQEIVLGESDLALNDYIVA